MIVQHALAAKDMVHAKGGCILAGITSFYNWLAKVPNSKQPIEIDTVAVQINPP